MLGRGAAEQHHHLGRHQLDLALEEGTADLRLLRGGRAVSGRAPVDDVGDVHVGFAQADGRQHLVEQLAGTADERLALQVLVASRRLADQHEARLRRAPVEAQVLGGRLETAAVEAGKRCLPGRRASRPPARPPGRHDAASGALVGNWRVAPRGGGAEAPRLDGRYRGVPAAAHLGGTARAGAALRRSGCASEAMARRAGRPAAASQLTCLPPPDPRPCRGTRRATRSAPVRLTYRACLEHAAQA